MSDPAKDRVLIVDDDASIRRMLTVSLRRYGYRIAEACDGGEALDAMRAGKADLVLLDLMMPKVTGWQVLAERDGDPALRTIPVIVITAGRGEQVVAIVDDGITAVLPKPFSIEALEALVKERLG